MYIHIFRSPGDECEAESFDSLSSVSSSPGEADCCGDADCDCCDGHDRVDGESGDITDEEDLRHQSIISGENIAYQAVSDDQQRAAEDMSCGQDEDGGPPSESPSAIDENGWQSSTPAAVAVAAPHLVAEEEENAMEE